MKEPGDWGNTSLAGQMVIGHIGADTDDDEDFKRVIEASKIEYEQERVEDMVVEYVIMQSLIEEKRKTTLQSRQDRTPAGG
jgi:phosphoribosylaminoimidazole carboxylase (NCAIR synthetase)